jgi:hypothetical protein
MPDLIQPSYFEMPLYQRVILAAVPGALCIIHYFLLEELGLNALEWLGGFYYTVLALLYLVLFAVLVLVPFMSVRSASRRGVGLLITAAIVAPILVNQFLNLVPASLDFARLPEILGVLQMVAIFLLLALALQVIGKLAITRRYWIYVALAGIFGGVSFVAAMWAVLDSLCFAPPYCYPAWRPAPIFIFLLVWPLLFCIAVYFGRDDPKPTA